MDFAIQGAGNGVVPGQWAGQTSQLIRGVPPEGDRAKEQINKVEQSREATFMSFLST